jgi:hypothetical protein
MRASLIVLFVLLVSAPAQAEPMMYRFTRTLGFGSYLQTADGTLTELDGVAFTATGFADVPLSAFGQHLFWATTTYDFGALVHSQPTTSRMSTRRTATTDSLRK